MTKPDNVRPQAAPADALAAQKERAARLRDAAGRFQARDPAPATGTPGGEPPSVTVPVAAGAHPGTYALRVDEGGLGLHAAPGACVIVEPVVPEGGGLAVFYLKERGAPVIFDLTHGFRPELAQPFGPGSEAIPMIELCEPGTGIRRYLGADRIERIHRITGVHAPAEIAAKQRPAPSSLPLMASCPEDMGEHYADDTAAYPLVRPGETVVFDPARREPTHGALCVLQWGSGRRSLLLTNQRQVGGKGEMHWWVDPVNRPPSREAMERRLAENAPGDMLHTSDGPFTAEHLHSKIVGTVVGVLVPWRNDVGHGEPVLVAPGLSPDQTKIKDDEPPAEQNAGSEDPPSDEDDTELLALGRQFVPAAIRDREACRAANEADKQGGTPVDVEAEFVAAADAATALAYRIAELPAHTAAGLRTKLRALAHHTFSFLHTRLPEHPDPDQALVFSLVQDLRRTEAEGMEETATVEQAARVPFGAVEVDTPLRDPREWATAFAAQALGMHAADKTLRMDKDTLVAFLRTAAERGDECDQAIFRAIDCARETFEGYAKLLGLARWRCLIAGSAMTVEDEAQHPEAEA